MEFHPISVVNKNHGAKGEYIGRGSPLGNPWPIGATITRGEVIAKYEEWIQFKIDHQNPAVIWELTRLAEIAMTRPLSLVCFCAPLACHGNIIKRIICEALTNH